MLKHWKISYWVTRYFAITIRAMHIFGYLAHRVPARKSAFFPQLLDSANLLIYGVYLKLVLLLQPDNCLHPP